MIKGVISKIAVCAMICAFAASPAFASSITAPANGSQLSALQTFTVDPAGQDYGWVYIGTTGVGSYNLHSEGIDNGTSFTVPGLPYDNSTTIYVRLWANTSGSWTFNDYAFIARADNNTDCAVITTPANNGDDTTSEFAWSDVGATKYWLYVGTTGVGSYNIYTKGQGTATSASISGMPADTTVYVRLYTIFGNFRAYVDTNYQTVVADMTTPANSGDRLAKPAQFAWTDDGADSYWLYIGSTQGGYDYYSVNQGANLSATVPGLPSDNSTVYVRLWSKHGSSYSFNDYNYIANGTGATDLAQITSPANDNDTLDNCTNPDNSTGYAFAWDNATYATKYWLYVGSSQGAYDYYSGGTTGLSACISGLPSASTVYVRLYTISGLFTSYVDSFYQTP